MQAIHGETQELRRFRKHHPLLNKHFFVIFSFSFLFGRKRERKTDLTEKSHTSPAELQYNTSQYTCLSRIRRTCAKHSYIILAFEKNDVAKRQS